MIAGGAAILLDAAVKGTVVLLAAGLAAGALRRSSASVRHAVWLLGLCGALVVPVLSVTLPGLHVLPPWIAGAAVRPATEELPPATARELARWSAIRPTVTVDDVDLPGALRPVTNGDGPRPAPVSPADTAGPPGDSRATSALNPSTGRSKPPPDPTQPPPGLFPAVRAWSPFAWLLGATVVFLPVLLGRLWLRRVRKEALPVTDEAWLALLARTCADLGVRRRVRLLQSPLRTMPMVWGVRRVTLLLPEDCQAWSPQCRRTVLLHELAHVARWDCLTRLLGQLACAVYWFHPLAWWAWRRMELESERACDDFALWAGSPPDEYAEHLVRAAAGLAADPLPCCGSIAMARRSRLEGRVLAILDPRCNRRVLTRAGLLTAGALIAAFVIPLSVLRAVELVAGPRAVTEPTVVYRNDFEHPAGPEWSQRRIERAPQGGQQFLGKFWNGRVTLKLADLPEHAMVRVTLDLYVLLSWDGSPNAYHGPDVWSCSVEGGPTLLRASFANIGSGPYQSFPYDYLCGPLQKTQTGALAVGTLGYEHSGPAPDNDSIYRLTLTFPHAGPDLTLAFATEGLNGADDELWGLDNVQVELLPPPPPPRGERLHELWDRLADADPMASLQAQWDLTAAGEQVVAFLADRLHQSPPAADAPRVRTLLAELDSDQWRVRDDASRALAAMGSAVAPVLREHLEDGDLPVEVQARVQAVLETLGKRAVPEACRRYRAMRILSILRTPEAFDALVRLADDEPDARRRSMAREYAREIGDEAMQRFVLAARQAVRAQRLDIAADHCHRALLVARACGHPQAAELREILDRIETARTTGAPLDPDADVILPPSSLRIEVACGGCLSMVRLPRGRFRAPVPRDVAPTQAPAVERSRLVEITYPLYISSTEVTRGEFDAVMGERYALGTDVPATGVSLEEALEFCRRLTAISGLPVRLPTEAEWEYAARCGHDGEPPPDMPPPQFPIGAYEVLSHPDALYAWSPAPMGVPDHRVALLTARQGMPNAWGLCGMTDGVLEWCSDGFEAGPGPAGVDPVGPSEASQYVVRGGGWTPRQGRARGDFDPRVGFRVVIDPLPPGGVDLRRPLRLGDFTAASDANAIETVLPVRLLQEAPGRGTHKAQWVLPSACRWTVEPTEIGRELAQGQGYDANFTLRFFGRMHEVFPLPRLYVTHPGDASRQVRREVRVSLSQLSDLLPCVATVRRIDTPPTLDGNLDDACWAGEPTLAPFIRYNGIPDAPQPTEVRMAYDRRNLYVAVRCYDRPEALDNLRALARERDGAVWQDDSVEIFIDTNLDRRSFYQFIANSRGARYDGRDGDASWDGDWSVAPGIERPITPDPLRGTPGRTPAWTLEFAIPFASLDLPTPKEGLRVGFNVVRGQYFAGRREISMWSPLFIPNNLTPSRFGTIVFEGEGTTGPAPRTRK